MDIPFEELRLATQNFQPDVLLGEGKFGPVFKGWIHEHFLTAVKPGFGIAVAVRKLNEREVYYFNEPHHPNLVKLIGYGFEEGSSALVYEFIPNGSLDNHLFTRGPQLLSWETRIKVAVGAARGLSFLHDLELIVTHEGVNSSSILLDDEFNPNLSDFALTRFASGSSKIVKNDYTAPEFTTKALGLFFWSYCLVFEFLTTIGLVFWSYPHDEAYTVGKLASQCLSLDPNLRPMMSDVVDALEQLQCLNTEAKLSHALSVGPHNPQNPSEPLFPADIDIKMDGAGSSKWSVIGPELSCGVIDENYLAAVKPGSGTFVAVKKMKHQGHEGLTEWVDKISQLCHPNLVTPIGYSSGTDQSIFVYEFIPKGSLDKHLFRRGLQQPLPWATRMRVGVGVARGLAFLHSLEKPVIYGVLNSGDILLDGDFNAKLSDVGLPKDISIRRIEAPFGIIKEVGAWYGPYAAPDYIATGQLRTRCDVYSFGVVLVELMSGRRALDRNRAAGKHYLMDWAKPYLGNKRRFLRIMDRRLEGEYTHKEAYKVGQIALQCVSSNPRSRPRMVVAALEKL